MLSRVLHNMGYSGNYITSLPQELRIAIFGLYQAPNEFLNYVKKPYDISRLKVLFDKDSPFSNEAFAWRIQSIKTLLSFFKKFNFERCL